MTRLIIYTFFNRFGESQKLSSNISANRGEYLLHVIRHLRWRGYLPAGILRRIKLFVSPKRWCLCGIDVFVETIIF